MPRGIDGYYGNAELSRMQDRAIQYHLQKGYSNLEAYDLAVEAVVRETGCGPTPDIERAERQAARQADALFVRPGRRTRESSGPYEDPERDTPRRRTQQPSRSAQSGSGTEYDRMFQNGGDKYASRTSGKILSAEEIQDKRHQIYMDLLEAGKHPDYARQQMEQFEIRENGKRVEAMRKAGYRLPDDDDEEEDDVYADRNACRGAGRTRAARNEYDDYGIGRDRSDRGSCRAEPEESSNTSYSYSNDDLKLMRKKIYEDWVKKGVRPSEAKREAEKWYNSKKGCGGGSSSRGSALDGFDDLRDALDDEDEGPRRYRSSRGPRSGKSRPPGWEGPEFDRYFTEEPGDDFRSRRKTPRYSSGDGSRGYRTEERRPGGGYSSNNYSGYDDQPMQPGGVKPAVDLYKLLGVSKIATVYEIKKEHKKLCMKYHPDRVAGVAAAKKAATDKMAQINQACDVLKNQEMRAYYDRTGLIASMGISMNNEKK